jgi:hypothetical protein
MIAKGSWGNNGPGAVVHRFHKRESCVFHSVHRFATSSALVCRPVVSRRVVGSDHIREETRQSAAIPPARLRGENATAH